MFRGITALNIDAKGRLAVPTRYRERLLAEANGQLVITIDTEDPCLLLYPGSEWEKIEQKIEALPSFNRAARRIQRLLIGHATELMLDSHGRIGLPPLLREYAALDKCIMLVGQGKKFEIWSENLWQSGRSDWIDPSQPGEDSMPPELLDLSL